jgi:hypothetical protein
MPTSEKCIWETTLTMPETYHAMIACNFAGGAAPSSFDDAMADTSKYATMFLSRCVPDGYCKFHFGPNSSSSVSQHHPLAGFVMAEEKRPVLKASDPCHAFGSNCSYCISHEYCGWCSTNVVYTDGTVGNNCAGFNPNPNQKNAFTCTGSYSTEMCLPGWACNPLNQTCNPTTPGSGVPKADCSTSCKAKPGPPSQLIGNWRGLIIQNGYPYGVIQVNMTATTVTTTINNQVVFSGTLKHLAADIFITPTSGPNKGSTMACIWTNQENELVEYIEIACGGYNAAIPENYKTPMKAPGSEVVLAKCASAHCNW